MSFKEIIEQGEALLNGKEFFIGTVVDRFSKASSIYPQDQAIKLMKDSFSKRFSKEGTLATTCQREVQELYDEACSLGDIHAFDEALGDLLLERKVVAAVQHDNSMASSLRMSSEDQLDIISEERADELNGLFSASTNRTKIAKFVEHGKFGAQIELESLGFDNVSVEIANFDENFVVYAAEVERGGRRFPLVIPAEVKLGTVLMPSSFVSNEDFVDLTKENIEDFISSGESPLSPNVIFEALAASKKNSDLSKTAAMYTDVNSTYSLNAPSVYSELKDEGPAHGEGFDFAKVAMPEELKGLADDMISETLIEAGLSFDRDTVLKAKATLSGELSGMGIYHDKIKIASEFPEGIVLATNIIGKASRKTIQVPLEVVSGRVLMPSKFISGEVTASFDEEALTSFANEDDSGDYKVSMSSNYMMRFSDLHAKALKNAALGNFVEVEDCLAVIEERFGASFHKTAFDDLMGLINLEFSSSSKGTVDKVEEYIKASAEKLRHKEANIEMSKNLIYMYPGEFSDEN